MAFWKAINRLPKRCRIKTLAFVVMRVKLSFGTYAKKACYKTLHTVFQTIPHMQILKLAPPDCKNSTNLLSVFPALKALSYSQESILKALYLVTCALSSTLNYANLKCGILFQVLTSITFLNESLLNVYMQNSIGQRSPFNAHI